MRLGVVPLVGPLTSRWTMARPWAGIYRITALLLTRSVWVGLGVVDDDPVVEVRDAERDVRHEPDDARHVIVVGVLRLVGLLVIVLPVARREIRDGNVVMDVVHLVAATI